MFKKRVLFLVLVLFLIPQIHALSISDAKLLWGNESIIYYSENVPLVVNLELTLQTDSLQGIVLDISDINEHYVYNSLTSNYDKIDISMGTCDQTNEGEHRCLFRNLVLNKKDPEIILIAKKGTAFNSFNLTLQETTANPVVTFIGSENCHENTCYIKSGTNNLILEFEGSDAGFTRGMIGYRVATVSGSVYKCEGSTCSANLNIACNDGDKFSISLANYRGRPSSDNAGRQITGPFFNLTCDSNPPVIQHIEVIEARDIGITDVTETFRIVANVTDSQSPKLNMKVLGDKINAGNVSGECVSRNNVFQCIASVRAAVEKRGTYDVPVIFSDMAGNEVSETLSVELVEILREETPDFWRVGNVFQTTNSLSIRNMGFERIIFIEVPLHGDADLLKANVPDFRCLPTQEEVTGSKDDVKDLSVFMTDLNQNKVYLRVVLREAALSISNNDHRYADYSHLEYDCGLELYSKKDGFFYSEPELKEFKIKFSLEQGHDLSEPIYERLERITTEIDDLERYLQSREYIMNIVDLACKGMLTVDAAKGTTGAVQLALALTGIGEGGAQAVGQVTDKLDGLDNSLMKYGLTACEVATCKLVDNLTQPLSETLRMDQVANFIGAETPQLFNPYKSEIIAKATLCYPAMLYHERVKQGILCNYAFCLSEGVSQMGLSVRQCEVSRSYDDCLRVAGNVLYAVPYTGMFTDLTADFGNLISDPAALMGGAVSLTCRVLHWAGVTSAHGACVIAQTALSLPTHYNRVTSLFDQIVLARGLSDPVNEQCAPVINSVSGAMKLRFEDDARMSAFNLFYEPSVTYTSEKELSGGRALRCAGSNCYVFDSSNDDAQLISRVSTSIDGVTTIYDATGKKEAVVAEGNFAKGFEFDWNKVGTFGEADELIHVALDSQTHMDKYYTDFKKKFGEEAYDYAIKANDIRSKRADRLRVESTKRDEVSAISAVFSHGDVGRRTTLGELYNIYGYDPHGNYYTEIDTEKFKETFGVDWDDFFGAVKKTYDKHALENPDEVTIRDLNKKAEDYVNEQGALKNLGEDLKEAFNDFMSRMSAQFVDTSAVALVRQGARGASTAADLFGWDDRRWAPESFAGRMADFININIAQPERAFCESKLKQGRAPVSGGDGAITSRTGGGVVPGAFINFRKSAPISMPGQETIYHYWVEGGVRSDRPGLVYRIYAYDSSNVRHDFTKRITGSSERKTFEGEMSSFGGFGRAFRLETELDLERICIHFDTNRLSDYFYAVSMTGNELCQKAVRE